MTATSEFNRVRLEREKTCGPHRHTWAGTWRHFLAGESSCGWCPEYVQPRVAAGRLGFVAAWAGAALGVAVSTGLWGSLGVWTALCVSLLFSSALLELRKRGSLVVGWARFSGVYVVVLWLLTAYITGEVTQVSVAKWRVEASDAFWLQFAVVGGLFAAIWLFGQVLNYWLLLKWKDQPISDAHEVVPLAQR
ncbi:MAG: hypothetical protein F4095_15405 [Acidimicrobiia bacterium]|nr:hypothetical protein [Acidimicrobiia bacterium]